jgi:Fe(3+) dicitrate transport protein
MRKTAILVAFLSSNAFADDLAPLSIFGGQEKSEIAGSAAFIGDEELKKSGYTDTERIMGRVPGVFSQTEDGLGLRTNIGMRGVNPNRTGKVNITEDGILQGPAVYSNPSMYFFPDVGDAEGIEVLKGATAIGNGPRTTAGAINYLSRSVPVTGSKGYLNQTFGDEGYARNHFYYGDSMGGLSYVFETHKVNYDGHKDVDGAANDGNTGFRKNSDLFKIRYTMPSSFIEFSSQNTSETSHASYIGLTRADFAANNYRRYAASSKDKMDNNYHRYIFTYGMDISPATSLVGKVYKAKYSRNWKKVGEMKVDEDGSAGGSVATVKLSAVDWMGDCAGDSGNDLRACNILTNGTAMVDGEYIKRSLGHRDYGMYGYDLRLNHVMGNHDITIGFRQHKDYRVREDSGIEERYLLTSGTMVNIYNDYSSGNGNEDYADAQSFSIIDRITHGNFVTTLGLRHEDVDYHEYYHDSSNWNNTSSNSETMLAASTVYNMGNGKSAFVAYSQGYMPSGINGPDKIEPEQSDNYEIGYRSASANSYMEIIGFHNDYEELTEICNVSAGCTVGANGVNNVGEAHVTGLEFVYRVNNLFAAPQVKGAEAMGSGIRYPMAISVTLQEAEHDATVTSSTKDGERIKYTPEEIYYVSLGAETNSWSAEIAAKYNDEVTNSGTATAAKTESAWIYDFRSGMSLDGMGLAGARAFLNIDNLFDKTYIASVHNYGARPNKPQTVMAGISIEF